MIESEQNLTHYIRYREVVKQRSREYYAKNKEKIKEKQRKNIKIK